MNPIRSLVTMRFADVAEGYIQALSSSSNPARPKTIASYRSIIRVHLTPRYGPTPLADLAAQNNKILRDLVVDLRKTLAPASIQLVVTCAKQILGSVKNENGLPLYPLVWANEYIDLPEVRDQKQPTVSSDEVRAVVQDGPDSTLYLLLAASGLRISEALNLKREHYADGVVRVIQGKTANAARCVDLHPSVAETMNRVVADVAPGARIFPGSLTVRRDRIRVPGFHSLRRFRESVLQRSECRNLLINYWIGHRDPEMGSRYAKQLLEDVAFRREWAMRVGTGW
jgi:integrase